MTLRLGTYSARKLLDHAPRHLPPLFGPAKACKTSLDTLKRAILPSSCIRSMRFGSRTSAIASCAQRFRRLSSRVGLRERLRLRPRSCHRSAQRSAMPTGAAVIISTMGCTLTAPTKPIKASALPLRSFSEARPTSHARRPCCWPTCRCAT